MDVRTGSVGDFFEAAHNCRGFCSRLVFGAAYFGPVYYINRVLEGAAQAVGSGGFDRRLADKLCSCTVVKPAAAARSSSEQASSGRTGRRTGARLGWQELNRGPIEMK